MRFQKRPALLPLGRRPYWGFISLSKREDEPPHDAMAMRAEEPPALVATGESSPCQVSVTGPGGRGQGAGRAKSRSNVL